MTALGDMKTFKGELKYLNQISLKGEILKMNKSSILYRPKILGDKIGYRDITDYVYRKEIIDGKEYFVKFNSKRTNKYPLKLIVNKENEDKFIVYFDLDKVSPILDNEVQFFNIDECYVMRIDDDDVVFVNKNAIPEGGEQAKRLEKAIEENKRELEILNASKRNLNFRLKRLAERIK